MTTTPAIRCRIAACPAGITGRWDFYLLNDCDVALDSAVLKKVSYEWGGYGHADAVHVPVANLGAGAHEKIWHDNGDGVEGRMDFLVEVRVGPRSVDLLFEFPILYKKTQLPIVPELQIPGWEEGRFS